MPEGRQEAVQEQASATIDDFVKSYPFIVVLFNS